MGVMHPRQPDSGLQTAEQVFSGRLPPGWRVTRAEGTWEWMTGLGPPIELSLELLHSPTGVQVELVIQEAVPEIVAWVQSFLIMAETMPGGIRVHDIDHRWTVIR